jgi:hypothetical protein
VWSGEGAGTTAGLPQRNKGKRIVRELIRLDHIADWEVENGVRYNPYTNYDGIYNLFMAGKAIPKAEKIVETGYDHSMLNLVERLYANFIINKINHPHLKDMKRDLEEDERRIQMRKEEMDRLFKPTHSQRRLAEIILALVVAARNFKNAVYCKIGHTVLL